MVHDIAMTYQPKIFNLKGAGDLVEVITEKTGIKKAVEKVAGKGCGCRKRRDRLNKLLPFRGE